jgi:CRP-like cAMP-binding protein
MVAHVARLPAELLSLLPIALHAACSTRRYARGETLFRAGRRPSSMYFVSAGEVALLRHGRDGDQVILQRTRHGFVAEASLQAERYHCDATALAESDVALLPLGSLVAALESDPAFALRWVAMLNKEVRRLRMQCERLSLNTVQARLLHLLRTESADPGVPIGVGLKFIAREIGVSHEALYRCLADLERRGLVERKNGFLKLVEIRSRR